ncbi:hypothetical protein ACH4U7_13435 [Streptomyces sp. NPDC020845]|uniref:hypothetical protein n=1 Tax=Streptomyces sp. NPDC020845 TaxID=3365096 RepID=UPI00378D8E59
MTEHAQAGDETSAAAQHRPASADKNPARAAESQAWSAFITHAAVCKDRCRTHGEDCETAAELRTVWRTARAEVFDQDVK